MPKMTQGGHVAGGHARAGLQHRSHVICSLHEAIYVYSPEDRAAEDCAILKAAMSWAVTTVIGLGTKIGTGQKEYTSLHGYSDKRGFVMKEAIDVFLSDIHIKGAPPEPRNKSKLILNEALF